MDVDLLNKYYTGKGMKIALIDNGIAFSNDRIKHYKYDGSEINEQLDEKFLESDNHGTLCGDLICQTAKEVCILRISDVSGQCFR